jgi:hypothetical protein
LAEGAAEIKTVKQVISTHGEKVVCSPTRDNLDDLEPCTHEEADTRMLLHAADAAKQGSKKILLRTVDTDVVVIAIASMQQLVDVDELWIAIGVGRYFRYIPAHAIADAIGLEKASALPLFHAFTGCDTVSFFCGRGKKTAWKMWNTYDNATDALVTILAAPQSIGDASMSVIERYVVLLYDRTSNEDDVNSARKHLFTQKNRAIDAIPPSQAALLQHTRRAVYQGAHIWGQALVPSPVVPCPSEWGWTRMPDSTWLPLWSTLPEAEKTCLELIRCTCKEECYGNCKCVKAVLRCTDLCKCKGKCSR